MANLIKETKHFTTEGLNKILVIKAGMNKGRYLESKKISPPKPHALVSLPL